MSRQIAALEDEVGVILLRRNNRTVSLTAAGQVFYEQSQEIVDAYNQMIRKIKSLDHPLTNSLKIGFGLYEHSFVAELIVKVRQVNPHLDISISQYRYDELIDHLKKGQLDIIFTMPSSVEYVTMPETVVYPVHYSDLYLVVHHQHAYANQQSISVQSLSDCTFITINEDSGPCSLEQLQRITSQSGLNLEKIITVNSLESQILMVEAGLGVAFMPSICKKHLTPSIRAILVEQFGGGHFVAMYQSDNHNVAIADFFKEMDSKGNL